MKNTPVKYNHLDTKGMLLPQAVDIEEVIIGGLLIDKKGLDEVFSIIKSEEVFYKLEHQHIFKAITDLAKENKPIDILTVSNQLGKNGVLELIGGQFYLALLSQKVSSTANIEYHSRIILQEWVKREIINKFSEVVSSAFAKTSDIFDLMNQSESVLDSVNEMINTGKSQLTFSEALDKLVGRVELLSSQEEHELTGVQTGFRKIDSYTGGWQTSDFIVIAARPGMGKTSLVLKGILAMSQAGDAVGMVSLEMDIVQLAARLVAIGSDFHLSQLIKKGFTKQKYWEKLNLIVGEFKELGIYIDDSPTLTIHQVCMKARMMKRKYNIKAFYIDYLQLISGDGSSGNREQEISIITRKLKGLAKELQIPVIALSQLNRSVETRGGAKRPLLSDLRESGAIEQDADIVAFIYRPEYYGIEPSEELAVIGANTELIFAKYRGGSAAVKGLYWQGDKTKFMDPEERLETNKQHFI